MRAGLSLETYSGVLKGGGSGEIVIPGRPVASMLFKVISHEDGVPQMPLGMPKLPDPEIAVIREWIQRGLLETATSQPRGGAAATPSVSFKGNDLNRPKGAPAMPEALPAITLPETARANPITALAASPWAPLIAVSGHERIYLYDLAKHAPAGALAFPEGIPYVLRFSRDGAMLLAAGGRGVQSGKAVLFDVKTGQRIAEVGNETDIVIAADVSADGKLIALGGPGKVVKVFSAVDGKQLYEIKKHTDWITALEFSPDGSKLASADRSGGIWVWESTTGGNLGNLAEHKDSVTCLSWRGDGQLLASGSEDGQIIIWNVADGFPLATVAKAHMPKAAPGTYGVIQGGILSVQFALDGTLVSVGRDNAIRLWTADGKPKGASQPASALLTKVAASFDSKLFVAGDFEGKLILFDGKASRTVDPRTAVTSAQR
jgi:WD40 repeat protein